MLLNSPHMVAHSAGNVTKCMNRLARCVPKEAETMLWTYCLSSILMSPRSIAMSFLVSGRLAYRALRRARVVGSRRVRDLYDVSCVARRGLFDVT